jgi:hypothetical protein
MYHGGYHPYWYDKVVGAEAAKKVNKGPFESKLNAMEYGPLLADMEEGKALYGLGKDPELKAAA